MPIDGSSPSSLASPRAVFGAAGLCTGRLLAIMVVAAALAITPWVIRNWEVFGEPVYSTNDGATLAGANCDTTYYGHAIGGFAFDCVLAVRQPRTDNRAVRARHLREAAPDYAGDHLGRAVVVAGLRLARLWGIYEPGDQIHLAGRNATVQRIGVVAHYLVLLAGLAGGILLLRRCRTLALSVLIVPPLVSSVTAVGTHGLLRLRHIAEVSLLVLAGIAVAYVLGARARSMPRRRRQVSASR